MFSGPIKHYLNIYLASCKLTYLVVSSEISGFQQYIYLLYNDSIPTCITLHSIYLHTYVCFIGSIHSFLPQVDLTNKYRQVFDDENNTNGSRSRSRLNIKALNSHCLELNLIRLDIRVPCPKRKSSWNYLVVVILLCWFQTNWKDLYIIYSTSQQHCSLSQYCDIM